MSALLSKPFAARGAGFTKLLKAEDERLLEYWKASDLWPRKDVQATSIFGESGNPSFTQFGGECWLCPPIMINYFSDHNLCFKKIIDRNWAFGPGKGSTSAV